MSEQLLKQRFQAKTEQLRQLREWVRQVSLAQGMAESRVEQVVIGVNEACMNIIEHAYHHAQGQVILEVCRDQDSVIYELTDFAQPMDCAKIKSRKLDEIRPGGLGVHFIQEVMDNVEYVAGDGVRGNKISMRVKI
jgi:sigma-B regulation protein RsbU (phosphoserine phosphatase)